MFGTDQKTEYHSSVYKRQQQPKKGGSFVDKLLDSGKLPELHYISPFYGFKKHNYTGPGTKFKNRTDTKQNPLPSSKPINRVDEASYKHDKAYENFTDPRLRKRHDDIMINTLQDIQKDKNADWRERADAWVVDKPMRFKRWLGVGTPKAKNGKKGGCRF